MPNRNGSDLSAGTGYVFGFNGMMKDNEVNGSGNSYTTFFRQYDPRIARWLSTDPIQHHQFSPYVAFDDNPIIIADPSGADGEDAVKPNKPTEHKVVEGDNLTKLAKKYKVSIEDLAKWNNITDEDKTIYQGESLIVSDPTEYNTYTKNRKESFQKVRELYGFLQEGQTMEVEYNSDGTLQTLMITGMSKEEALNFNKSIGRKGKFLAEMTRDAILFNVGGQLWTAGKGAMQYARLSKNLYAVRLAYVTEVLAVGRKSQQMINAGKSLESVARWAHAQRRALGVTYKGLTSAAELEVIYARNLAKYGDKLGPTIEYLRKQGKTWGEIIKSASKPGGKDVSKMISK